VEHEAVRKHHITLSYGPKKPLASPGNQLLHLLNGLQPTKTMSASKPPSRRCGAIVTRKNDGACRAARHSQEDIVPAMSPAIAGMAAQCSHRDSNPLCGVYSRPALTVRHCLGEAR